MPRQANTVSTRRLLHTGLENYDHVELDAGEVFFAAALNAKRCPCCNVALAAFEHERPSTVQGPGQVEVRWLRLQICPRRGWWHYNRDMGGELDGRKGQLIQATCWELTHALQVEIDLASQSLPLEQLQHHLSRRWEDRKLMSAQQAEDLVAGLLKDHHGGEVTRLSANANSADNGTDLYLARAYDGTIQRAIQVKRRISGDVEGLAEVRNFAGAMILEGFDEGIFVTTASRFSKPAEAMPIKAAKAKFRLELELIDGARLLEMLHATIGEREVQLPPLVELGQTWRDPQGRKLLASDLFLGDFRRILGR